MKIDVESDAKERKEYISHGEKMHIIDDMRQNLYTCSDKKSTVCTFTFDDDPTKDMSVWANYDFLEKIGKNNVSIRFLKQGSSSIIQISAVE